jgi:hypothetical protein
VGLPPPSSARPSGPARFLPHPYSVLGPAGLRAEWREAVADCNLEFEFEAHQEATRDRKTPQRTRADGHAAEYSGLRWLRARSGRTPRGASSPSRVAHSNGPSQ